MQWPSAAQAPSRCASQGWRQPHSTWHPLEHPAHSLHEPERKKTENCLAPVEQGCMVGVWSVEPECRLGGGGNDDGVKRDCSPLPHAPCGYLPDEDRKAVSVGPATWRGSKSFSCVSVVRGTMSSFLSLKGLSGLPSTMGWVGASAWLHWRTGLSYTTDLLTPEYMVLACCKVIASLLGSRGSNPPQTPSLVVLAAPSIVQLMGPSLPSSS